MLQLAAIGDRGRGDEEPSASGRPFEGSHTPTELSDAWHHDRLGLMKNLDPDAVWWALLTESSEALLRICADSVNHSGSVFIFKFLPQITAHLRFNSHKRLDWPSLNDS